MRSKSLKSRTNSETKKMTKDIVSSEISILEAYIELAQRKGVANITLQEIADHAGVAFGTVRYHFNQEGRDITQEALLHLVKKAYMYLDERIFQERSRPDFNPIHSYMRAMFTWVRDSKPAGSLLVYYYYLCTTQAAVAIPNAVFLERARLRIESLFHEAVGRKLYAPVDSAAEIALKIHLAVLGGCIVAGTSSDDAVYEQQLRLCIEIADSAVTPLTKP